ncbi:MAG: translation initiation factor IF-3 [Patescibacteria group bacterium]
MRKSYKFKRKEKEEKSFNANRQILAPKVNVIDETNSHLGIIDTSKALQLAEERGFDLVEVSPLANPPVAKFLNLSSFLYQREKLLKKQKKNNKTLDVKSVRLSIKIGEHDLATKVGQADRFLEKGHKVKIELILRGREMSRMDLAREVLEQFLKMLSIGFEKEQDTSRQGNKVFMIIMPTSKD